MTAVKIRLNAAVIAHLKIVGKRGWPDFHDFDGEFMTEDTRIGKEWLMSLKSM